MLNIIVFKSGNIVFENELIPNTKTNTSYKIVIAETEAVHHPVTAWLDTL